MSPRLLFVLDRLALGGAELHTVVLAEQLALAGTDCKVMAVRNTPDSYKRPRIPATSRRPERLALVALLKLLRGWQPAVAVVTQPPALLPAFVAAALAGWKGPVVYVMHRMPYAGSRPKTIVKQWLLVRLANRADAVVYPSRTQMLAWQDVGLKPAHSRLIGNGVDLQRFSEAAARERRLAARAAYGFGTADIVVGTCCVLRKSKYVDDFIRTVQILHRENSQVRALIVGDGPERQALEQLATELGLAHVIHFTGYSADVASQIAAMDIGLLCSHSEVFGLFAAECMAMGKPMVMANAGGSPEVIDHGKTGSLFEIGDVRRIAAAVAPYLSAEARQQAGRRAGQVARERFSLQAMIEHYQNLFVELDGKGLVSGMEKKGEVQLLG